MPPLIPLSLTAYWASHNEPRFSERELNKETGKIPDWSNSFVFTVVTVYYLHFPITSGQRVLLRLDDYDKTRVNGLPFTKLIFL